MNGTARRLIDLIKELVRKLVNRFPSFAAALALLSTRLGRRSRTLLMSWLRSQLREGVSPAEIERSLQERYKISNVAALELLSYVFMKEDERRCHEYAERAIAAGSVDLTTIKTYITHRQRLGHFRGLTRFEKYVIGSSLWSRRFEAIRANLDLLDNGFAPALAPSADDVLQPKAKRTLYLLHNSLPINSGGYATRTHGLLLGIAEQGYETSGVTRLGYPYDRMNIERELDNIDEVDGIKYFRNLHEEYGIGRQPITEYLQKNVEAHVPLVRAERPSILHAASNFINGVTANALAKKFGIKSIYEVRGLWEVTRLSREPGYDQTDAFAQYVRMETQACREADRVICITDALAREMVARGVDPHKISVVPNGVHVDRFEAVPRDVALARELGIGDGDVVIGYVGSVVDYEGLDDLVRALGILTADGYENVKGLIVGDGAALPECRALVHDLGLDGVVVFTGRVPHEEVERYYSLVSIAPFPRKPLPVCEMVSPLKPFEAMAMEKCVIVSSVAALTEIVSDGQTGLVFEKGSVDALVAALRRAIDDPHLRESLGKEARAWVVQNRDWKTLSRRVTKVYGELERELGLAAG